MAHPPCRITQGSCIAVVVLGLMPWSLMLGSLALNAIESTAPLPMTVIVWLVLLVPLWVLWFAIVAWNKRNETALPAVLMAAPTVIVTALFMALPVGVAIP